MAMPSIADLAALSAGWSALYADSTLVSTTVTTIHLLALLGAGGLAIAADRLTLRATVSDAPRIAQELRAVHRPVLVALAILFVSGLALAAADLETFLVSPVFWAKLGLVALLLANGGGLARAESRVRASSTVPAALWRRLRMHAWASLSLWVLVTIAGTVLVNAA